MIKIMSEVKDPRIKLFGKTIQLPEALAPADEAAGIAGTVWTSESTAEGSSTRDAPSSSSSGLNDGCSITDPESQESEKVQLVIERCDEMNEEAIQATKTEEEIGIPLEKTLKKPDRILPCPRCSSMDTKFCYFNNYNTNQPRHFCKNCQRYWTAGGTMRNVPVGAGRRKNKSSTAQFRHMDVSESGRVDGPNGIHPMGMNSTVLTFSSDAPLCDSMVSSVNIADKTPKKSSNNGYGDDISTETSVASSKDGGLQQQIPNCGTYPHQLPCFPGAPLPYPWHAVPPTFAYPMMPFYSTAPPSYWFVCTAPTTIHPSSGASSPILGKHSRDDTTRKPAEETQKDNTSERRLLWAPKTLRIDDPGGADIWTTLGIKKDGGVDCVGGNRSIFKAFQSKLKETRQDHEASTVLQANPAALSRSLSFLESS